MIERMKKLTFLVTAKEYNEFIAGLREQGVVHVQQLKQGQTSPALQKALDERVRYQQAIDYLNISLKAWEQEAAPLQPLPEERGLSLLELVETLKTEEVALRHKIDEAEKNIQKLEPWGNFDWGKVKELQEKSGMQVFFYACAAKSFQAEWAEKYFATPIDEYRKRTYFLAFANEEPDIKAERLELPNGSLDQYKKEAEKAKAALQATHDTTCQVARQYKEALEEGLKEAQGEIQLRQVELSDESIADGAVRLMVGWTLEEKADDLAKWLTRSKFITNSRIRHTRMMYP